MGEITGEISPLFALGVANFTFFFNRGGPRHVLWNRRNLKQAEQSRKEEANMRGGRESYCAHSQIGSAIPLIG